MHHQLTDILIIPFKGLPELSGNRKDVLFDYFSLLLPLTVSGCLDDGEELLPMPCYLEHGELYLLDHLSNTRNYYKFTPSIFNIGEFITCESNQCMQYRTALFNFINHMLKLGLSNLLRTFSTSPVLKRAHHFSELELRQLLSQPNELRQAMIQQIKQMGELSVPNYWKQALTDQRFGYYRQQNVFSKDGDFITAPEISTLFGEMVATWITVFLQSPKVNAVNPFTNAVEKPFRLVQLGGGRGMLMQDILRSFHSYQINNHFQLCFIEISEYNRKQQQQNVMEEFKKNKTFFKFDYQNATPLREEFFAENQFKEIRLRWFSKLQDLIKEDYEAQKKGKEVPLTIFVMNEFFDALPISIIEYTAQGWREKVLKLSQSPEFPLILDDSSQPLHPKLTPNIDKPSIGDRIQISPESYIAMDMMAKMIKMTGGAILNIDYGGNGPFIDSIRAIKNHKYIPAPHYWQIPGVCDLSAHVAFAPLAQYAEKVQGIKAFELIPQQFFLEALGIETRFQNLSKGATKAKLQRLQSEIKRLTSPEEMGQFFKVQIISLKEYGQIYPHISYNPNVF